MQVSSSTSHTDSSDVNPPELRLLYQFSNTLLSTIRLNKLTHLVLTALTHSKTPLFERAMLFLYNEKSRVLQGMLGVINSPDCGLILVGDSNCPLGNRWDIADETIQKQRDSHLCKTVRSTRIDTEDSCIILKQVVERMQLCHLSREDAEFSKSCAAIKHLCSDTFAAVPLGSQEKLIGVILVDNPKSRKAIQQHELNFLHLFARQAGMAIENSMLYNRMEDAHFNLKEARERLLHGERLAAIGEMAANLAHELKHPLVTIGGFAGRLIKSAPKQSREREYAETILKETVQLEKMLADILNYSRKPSICYKHCNIVDIINESLESCFAILEEHCIKVSLDLEKGCWLICGDQYQLKQVFLNLLLNSAEAMPNGGQISIELHHLAKNNAILLTISDNGGGIPADILARVFSPFFTTKNNGTGLGLPIVHRIILNHSGTIEANNNDQGAVFKISLPLVKVTTSS